MGKSRNIKICKQCKCPATAADNYDKTLIPSSKTASLQMLLTSTFSFSMTYITICMQIPSYEPHLVCAEEMLSMWKGTQFCPLAMLGLSKLKAFADDKCD